MKETVLKVPEGTSLLTCFHALETFGPFLLAVDVHMTEDGPGIELKDLTTDIKMELGNLKYLSICQTFGEGDNKISKLDALYKVGSTLAFLDLGDGLPDHLERLTEEHLLWQIAGDIYETNVWQDMPSLLEIKLKGEVYKRSVYERYKSLKQNANQGSNC